MLKKLSKYIKLLICGALVLSLVAPSYASLSASDGSAFVTKAEFDSALADFNSRLTTFEAGINSKIDSQVTSYLDRNGIWAKALQEIHTSTVEIKSNQLPGKTKATAYDKQYSGIRLIDKTTKSGLLCVISSQFASNNRAIWGLIQTSGTFTRVWDSSFAIFGYYTNEDFPIPSALTGTVIADDALCLATLPIGSGYGKAIYDGYDGGSSQSFGVFTQVTPVRTVQYFFIQSGVALNFYLHASYYIPSGTSFSYADNIITLNFEEMSIY